MCWKCSRVLGHVFDIHSFFNLWIDDSSIFASFVNSFIEQWVWVIKTFTFWARTMCQGPCDSGFTDEQGPIPALKKPHHLEGGQTDTLRENHGAVVIFHFIVGKERPVLKWTCHGKLVMGRTRGTIGGSGTRLGFVGRGDSGRRVR